MIDSTNHTDRTDETSPGALDLELQNLDELRAAIADAERTIPLSRA